LLINEGRLIFDGPTSELGDNDELLEEKFHELTLAAV
jgi:ABC-2 type transport system ATP-binding protein